MKWYTLLALFSLSAFAHGGSLFDSERCLPPPEGGESFFPRCKEFFSNVELLYWTVEEGALDYAVRMKCADWAPLDSDNHYATGKVHRGTFDWKPGVRLLVGFYNAPKYWEIFAQYTYLQDYGHNKVHKPEEDNLFLNGTFPQLFDELLEAKSYTSLNYQVLDILFARVFDPNPHLRMRLIAGVTGAFLDQAWKVCYQNEELHTNNKNSWRFASGGLRIGVAGDWWWKWNLYFTGKATFAGYVGRYANRSTIHTNCSYERENPVQHITYKDCRYVQHMQLLLGPSWQCMTDCYHWELFAGYELNGWFNLQEVYRSEANSAAGSHTLFQNTSAFALQGITIRATVGF